MPSNQEQLACSLLVLQDSLRHNPVMAALAAEVMNAASQMSPNALQSLLNNNNTTANWLGTDRKAAQDVSGDEEKLTEETMKRNRPRINRKRKQEEMDAPPLKVLVESPVECSVEESANCSEKAQLNSRSHALHKIRKLKLYSVEEKIDIIDYAKVIGNRAAGREFNVAESSIREWRKNEERLKRQSDQPSSSSSATNNTGFVPAPTTQHFERDNPEIIAQIDTRLVEFINEKREALDWYCIRDKAQEVWSSIASQPTDMSISMGWVARFMSRSEGLIPKLAPPIIATANSINGNNGSLSMVRCANKASDENLPSNPRVRCNKRIKQSNSAETKERSANSRRKSQQPRRLEHATLLTTSQITSQAPTISPSDSQEKEVTMAANDFSQTYNSLAIWLLKNSLNGHTKLNS